MSLRAEMGFYTGMHVYKANFFFCPGYCSGFLGQIGAEFHDVEFWKPHQ